MDDPTPSSAPTFASLQGRAALVTGASSGIGRAIAIELASAGADVLVHAAHSESEANSTADRIRALGRESGVLLCDFLQGEPAVRLFVSKALKWRKPIDVLVNAAGFDVLTGDPTALDYHEKLERLLEVDVKGTMLVSRAIADSMQPGSSIVNIGWDHADWGMEGDSGEFFSATKAAVMAFTRSLAKSLAPNVRVNCIAPGWIKTAWGAQASQEWQRRARGESLMNRWGTPEDVARVARFLASDASSFVNGQVIRVNGGFRTA